jgi:hypothetical protein
MFGRKSEIEKRLDAAKLDVAAARTKLSAIDAREVEALADSAAFATWSAERKQAATEVDRLERLTTALASNEEDRKRHEVEAALQKRVDAAKKNNAAVAERMRMDGAKLAAALKALARDVAASQVETAAINKLLPDGTPHLIDANNLARGRPAIPRENISEKTLQLWCRATDGGLMGDQDAVVEADAGKGHLVTNGMRIDCVRREFRSVQYHPEIWSEIPEPLHALLRLPNFDRPFVDFDGQFMVEKAVAELNLDPPKADKKARRPVQTELIPTAPWSPLALKPVGAIDSNDR